MVKKDACVSNHRNTEDGFWPEKFFLGDMVPQVSYAVIGAMLGRHMDKCGSFFVCKG